MLTPPRTYPIGPWEFSPRDNELRRGEERRRLEDRAARTLELLCRQRGETVSNVEIIDQVWMGRQLSPNSVAVVISGLRAALDDDARTPRYIETVAKRGYRLLGEAAADVPIAGRSAKRPLLLGAGLALLGLLGFLAWFALGPGPTTPSVAFSRVVNDTGSPRYEPVARSVDGLIETGLARGGVRQLRPVPGRALPADTLSLEARLILWTGTPTVNFLIVDSRGEVVASGMAGGPPPRFPTTVGSVIDQFAGQLKARQEEPPT